MYLNLVAETGYVGFALFMLFLVSAVRMSIQAQRVLRAHSPNAARQLQLLNAGLLGFLLACVFATLHRSSFLYLYVAVIFVLADLALQADSIALQGGVRAGRTRNVPASGRGRGVPVAVAQR